MTRRSRMSARLPLGLLVSLLLVHGSAASDPRIQGLSGRSEPAEPAAPTDLDAAAWTAIRSAHQANLHAVVAVEGELRARNPGQAWWTRFDGRGVGVQPDSGGWEWGLELLRWGFAGSERCTSRPAGTSSSGSRVSYTWEAALEEWYVNDARGLEHGYTVYERPAGGDATEPLTLTLAVRGGLLPVIGAGGTDVRFLDARGLALVTYSGLAVLDADGRRLSARFERVPEGLLLLVEERDARYPLTIDPIAQQAYLKASNPGGSVGGIGVTGDLFGGAVAVSGDLVVVGAPFEDSAATGVNGSQANEDAMNSGAAYVFRRSGSTWTQEAYLKASNTEGSGSPSGFGDSFGVSVAVSGNIVAVGAAREDSSSIGVNGDQANNAAVDSGAVYVFVHDGTTWNQEAYLKPFNTEAGDRFGIALSLSGDTLLVGADRESSGATGVNGDPNNNAEFRSGAAYVFRRSGTAWSQEAYLKASNTDSLDNFGSLLAISGDTAVVGAAGEDSFATGVNGNQNSESGSRSGAAYVFARAGTDWSQEAYLKASNTGLADEFGFAVGVAGDLVVVGAPFEDSHAKTINGDQSSNRVPDAGAAYVFVRNGSSWSQEAYLKASNAWGGIVIAGGDEFGHSVAAFDSTVVVGAWGESSDATGVNGNQVSNNFKVSNSSGAAYVFARTGTSWNQMGYLKASNTASGDHFGSSVGTSSDTVIVGALHEDSAAAGVNGNQLDDSAFAAGAAYVYAIDPQSAVTFRNAGTNPASYAANPIVVGSVFTATVDNNLAAQSTSVLFAFNSPYSFTLSGGQTLLCLDWQGVGELFTGGGLYPSSSMGGIDGFSLFFPNDPAMIGISFASQAIQFGNPPFLLSNAQDLTIGSF